MYNKVRQSNIAYRFIFGAGCNSRPTVNECYNSKSVTHLFKVAEPVQFRDRQLKSGWEKMEAYV